MFLIYSFFAVISGFSHTISFGFNQSESSFLLTNQSLKPLQRPLTLHEDTTTETTTARQLPYKTKWVRVGKIDKRSKQNKNSIERNQSLLRKRILYLLMLSSASSIEWPVSNWQLARLCWTFLFILKGLTFSKLFKLNKTALWT